MFEYFCEPRNHSSFHTWRNRGRKKDKEGWAGGEEHREFRERRKTRVPLVELDAWQIRFSNLRGSKHFRALFRRSPPRIELSVQISILTANLPANSPLLRRGSAAARATSSFLHQRPSPPFSIHPTFLAPRVFLFARSPRVCCAVSREEATLLSLLSAPNFLTP